MRYKFSVILIIILSVFVGFANINKPETAEMILHNSLKLAELSNKPVLVIFHASWCIWCKHLEAALNSPELKKIIDDNFIVTYIDVLEQKDKQDELENPGGDKIMNDFGGKDSGLPFYVFLNSNGKIIVNSEAIPENQNIGYPVSESEITAFSNLLKKSSSKITNKQITTVKEYLEKNAPKH